MKDICIVSKYYPPKPDKKDILSNTSIIHTLRSTGKSAFDESNLLNNLSEKLRREVVMFLNADIIQKIPIFQGIDDKLFISNLMSIMNPTVCSSGDMIIKEGSYGQQMYFLVKGCVEITGGTGKNGKKLKQYIVLREGAFFGELSLLLNTKRSATISALTRCNLFVLTKRNLDEIMLFYPQLKQVLRAHVVGLVKNLDKRGVKLHEEKTNEELVHEMLDDSVFDENAKHEDPDHRVIDKLYHSTPGKNVSNVSSTPGEIEMSRESENTNNSSGVLETEVTESGKQVFTKKPKRRSVTKILKKNRKVSPVSRFLKKRLSLSTPMKAAQLNTAPVVAKLDYDNVDGD